jgi:hypothetical protein
MMGGIAGNERFLTHQMPAATQQQLQALRLERCFADVGAVTSGMAQLTRLQLDGAVLLGSGSGLAQLRQLTSLQHLEVALQYVDRERLSGAPPRKDITFPAGVLSSLVRLTHLELGNIKLDSRALDGLWRLHRLQRVHLQRTKALDFTRCMPEEPAADGMGPETASQLGSFRVTSGLQDGSTAPLLAYLQQQTQLTDLVFSAPCLACAAHRLAATQA